MEHEIKNIKSSFLFSHSIINNEYTKTVHTRHTNKT